MDQRRMFGAAVALLLVASVGINVLQAQRIRSLVDRVPVTTSATGTRLSTLTALDLAGRQVTRSLTSGVPTVLYHFSSTCTWCERNWTNVEALAKSAGGRYRVIAVTMESEVPQWLTAAARPFEVLRGMNAAQAVALSLGGTPHTLVVGGDGLVIHDWPGAYSKRVARQVEETFGLALPGLTR